MSKELTPLEASMQLKDFVLEFVKNGLDRRFVNGSFDIIETALKEKENIEKSINELFSENGKVITTIEIKKKLKALELIQDFNVDVRLLRNCETLHDYNIEQDQSGINDLPQDIFDLLKEVLL